MNRRTFLSNTGVLVAASAVHPQAFSLATTEKTIRVVSTSANFEREPLLRPFGFKGGYMTEMWQTASKLVSDTGKSAISTLR